MVRPGFPTLALIAAVGLLVLAPGTAFAQACQALRAELARASGGGGANSAELAALERQAHANGCRGKASWGRPRACAGIDARIAGLRSGGGGGGNARRVRQLEAQVARACSPAASRQANAPQTRERQQPARARQEIRSPESGVIIHGTRPDNRLDNRARGGGGFFASLFGGVVEPAPRGRRGIERIVPEDDARERVTREREARDPTSESEGKRWLPGAPKGSNFKTWCVRLCDGYYFPIQENTSSSSFGAELAACVKLCPGAEVSLYAHKTYSQPESMVSAVTGEPYIDLPTAFAYRKAFYPTCGCQPATDIREAKVPDRLPGIDEDGEEDSVIASARAEHEAGTGARDGPAGGVTELAVSEVDRVGGTAERLRRVRARLTPSGGTEGKLSLAPGTSMADAADGTADPAAKRVADDLTLEEALAIGNGAVTGAAVPSKPPLRVREVGPRFFAVPSTVVSLPAPDPAPVQ